jgi:hypothetical protein
MSYLTQNDIASNRSMNNRVGQAVAQEGWPAQADSWTEVYRRGWASAPGWDAAWESAKVNNPPDPDAPPGVAYDPGADEAVITDAQILAQVQAMLTEYPPVVADPEPPDEGGE